MKRLTYLLIVVIAIFLTCGQAEKKEEKKAEEAEKVIPETEANWRENLSAPVWGSIQREKNPVVVMETNLGNIEIELYWKESPKTAENFLYLVNKEFYNGLTFHRIVPNFVIQGGDPKGNGTGGSGYQIADEPTVKKHERGALAMAKSGPNTAGCQFYISLSAERTSHLDKDFTVFAHVIAGMDVVDKIAQVPTDARSFPQEEVKIIKAYEKE